MEAPLSAYARIVRTNTNFRRLWCAQIVSELGDFLYTVAIYSVLLELTHSAKSVALAFVLQLLPQLFAAPIAGVVNDRMSRRRVMIAADLARATIVLGMLFVTRAQIVPLIYVLLLLESIMWAFFEPGRSSVIPNIVPPADLAPANALSSATWSLNLLLGAGLGGVIAAFLGRDTVYLLDVLSFLVSATLIRGMRFAEPHLAAAPSRSRAIFDFTAVAEGVRYIARNRRIYALLLVKAGLGFLGTHWVLLPILGERVFPVASAGPARGPLLGIGVLMGAGGVGSLLGPLAASYWAGRRRSRLSRGIVIGFLVCGFGYFVLWVAPSLAPATLGVILAQCGGSTVWIFSTTLLQFRTKDQYRGRVFSADTAFLVVTMSFANSVCGTLVDAGIPARSMALATALLALLPAAASIYGLRLLTRARRTE